jgi:trimeric autotransporter adhesin
MNSRTMNTSGTMTSWGAKMRPVVLLAILGLANAFSASGQINTITTVAGGELPNNVPPTTAGLEGVYGVARDASGNLFVITDVGVIYKVTPGAAAPSSMAIYAGNITAGYSGDGGPAASALLWEPFAGAVDAAGDLYFSDSDNCVVREIVASTGIINTVAGNGTCRYSGDGGAATSAELNYPQGIALDTSGNLFIVDYYNDVIREVNTKGIISTYAGVYNKPGYAGDGGAATSAELDYPEAVATDTNGNLYIADSGNNVIRRVNTDGDITTVVGIYPGNSGYSGDGGAATSALMNYPAGIAVDSSGNLYISDTQNAVIREVTASTGDISTIVGNHAFGFGGDGGAATSATLSNPFGLAVDSTTGNLWIADYWNNRIRLYTPSNKTINTVVGDGSVYDGSVATSASLYFPRSPALDANGNLYITDANNNRIREVDASTQVISTVVGNGIPCAYPTLSCGDNGPATSASITIPRTITVEPSGILLVSDAGDNRIRMVSTGGTITTIAGSGNPCTTAILPCGDGGPATSADITDPRGVVLDSSGNMYFVDPEDNRVKEVNTMGIITTFAGNGPDGNAPTGCQNGSYTGDGGSAVSATLDCPLGLDIDSNNNLYIADTYNNVIRKIEASTGIITTIAGTGSAGYTGDGGPATSATLNSPDRVSVNGAGNFFISDSNNNVIRRVDGITQIIKTFAGNGKFGFAGDGGPALSASFALTIGVVVTPQGNLYVGDLYNNRIRKVTLNPAVTLSPTSIPFGNQAVNVSGTQPVMITNSGDAPLAISSIAIPPGAFTIASNTCPISPATLAIGAQCMVQIAFEPTQFISYAGTMTITDNAPTAGSTQTVSLSGMGAASLSVAVTGSGTVTSMPAGINACSSNCNADFTGNSMVTLTAAPGSGSHFSGWGGACSGTSTSCNVTMSQNQSVTAAFAANAVLAISKSHMGNFTQGQTGATYTVTVSNGANAGATSGTVTVTDSAPTGLTVTQMSGTGWTCETPSVSACTRNDSLGGGASYPPVTVTVNVASNASSPLVNSVTVSGGGSANMTATDSTTIVPPATPVATLNPVNGSTLAFGLQAENLGSASKQVTLTNTGTAALTVTSISVTAGAANFSQTSNCPALLPVATTAPSTCTINVVFDPTALGPLTGTLTVKTNDPNKPMQTISLTGTGVPSGPAVATLNPAGGSTLGFGNQVVNVASTAMTVTLTNTGGAALGVTGISINEEIKAFSQTDNCPESLTVTYPAASCTIYVVFTPTSLTSYSGTLVVTTSDQKNPTQTITLTGTGVPGGAVTLSATTINFGDQVITIKSGPQTVTLTNSGSGPLSISSIVANGDYVQANTCPVGSDTAPLAAGGTCTITVTFTPTQTGTRNGSLVLSDNATNSPQTITLTGTGTKVGLAPGPGSSTTATVDPGGTGVFGLVLVTPPGTTGTATLSCSSPDGSITCLTVPSTVNLTGKTVETAVIVNSYCTGNAPPAGAPNDQLPLGRLPLYWLLALCALAMFTLGSLEKTQRQRVRLAMAPGLLTIVMMVNAACGNLPKSPTGAATTPGTYTLNITATLDNSSFTIPVTLIVK